MWYIGQEVKCIEDGFLPGQNTKFALPPIRKGNTYIISNILECKCGSIKLDIGLVGHGGGTMCICGTRASELDAWWCHSTRFAPKETNRDEKNETEFREITWTKVIENIPALSES